MNHCINVCANPGDTILVPDGSATWSNPLVITKGVKLVHTGENPALIINGQSGSLITYDPSDYDLNSPFRLSGLTFDMNNSGRWMALGQAAKPAPFVVQDRIRIDHNRVYNCSSQPACVMWNYCDMYGVVDNNSFEDVYYGFKSDTQGTEDGWWQTSPQRDFAVGSEKFLYFEDNSIAMKGTDNVLSEGQYSGRYAWRYNTIIGAASYSLFEMHGHQTDGGMGSCFGAEIYGNDIDWGSFSGGTLYKTRGGQSMVFCNNNTSSSQPDNAGYMGSLWTCPSVCPCLQMIHGSYWFNNRVNLTGNNLATSLETTALNPTCCSYATYIEGGVHVMTESTAPGITSGPLQDRPTNPVVGQSYWATDQSATDLTGMVGANPANPISGTLYFWGAAGVWEEVYRPYTYPHPLRTEDIFADGFESGSTSAWSLTVP